ncbi:SANT/Myb-like DNA-binding domain-containing protein [Sphingobium olei]|uniref:SANT/Myb-like DNA-binding domain-containing protein n=1 Tax=Sphingobium olei TaxID=420955 RepID=A0ABW3NW27_9SPHN
MKPITQQQAVEEAVRKAKRVTATTQYRDDRLQRCFAILERAANDGATCPTNNDLAEMLGYCSGNGPSGLVNLLEVSGYITVERSNCGRVVTISRTGKRTAGIIVQRRPGDWTEDQDAILMDGIAEGETFASVGAILGKTKSACKSRFSKIAAAMGEQAQ